MIFRGNPHNMYKYSGVPVNLPASCYYHRVPRCRAAPPENQRTIIFSKSHIRFYKNHIFCKKHLIISPFFNDMIFTHTSSDRALYRICSAVFLHHPAVYTHPAARNESSMIPFIDPLHFCTAFLGVWCLAYKMYTTI